MKKLLFVLPAVLCIGACNAENAEKVVNVMGVECAWVANGEMSELVKCPAVPELVAMQEQTPNSMFQEGDFSDKPFTKSLAEISNDIKHFTDFMAQYPDSILVNVVPDECGTGTTGYRIIVKEPVLDGVAMYAVGNCLPNE